MVRLNIDLPDDLSEQLRTLATETGHASLESFVRVMLIGELAAETVTPPDPTLSSSEEKLEAILAERVNDPQPLIEFTPALIDDIKRRVLGDRGVKGG